MDERRMMEMRDGRRLPPRNSRGEFRRRRSRRDRGMDYGTPHNMRSGMHRDYGEYNYNMSRMDRMDYASGMDGHHPQAHGSTYYPIQAMGTFEGYYGMPEQDYAYDMRGMGRGRDYGYPTHNMHGRDYRYDYGDYGDYGETLSEQEMEHWCKKLKSQLDEREKQMFSKEMISQKAKQMGLSMDGFGEKELEVATLMSYTDYKRSIGQNPDLAIKLAYDWLTDKDVAVKGAEKLAVYYDEIVMGGEYD